MTIFLSALENEVREGIGDTDSAHYNHWPEDILNAIERATLNVYNNEQVRQQFDIVGAGSGRYFSPDPTRSERHLILLFTSRALWQKMLGKHSLTAITRGSPLGNINLTNIPDQIRNNIKDLNAEITKYLQIIWHDDVMDNGIEARPMSESDPDSVNTTGTTGETSYAEEALLGSVLYHYEKS